MPDHILPAIGYRLISVIAFTSMGALIKLAEKSGAGFIETLLFRQLCSLPIVLLAVMIGPGLASLKTSRLPAHMLRMVVGLTSMAFMFGAIRILPLAEATTLQFTMPIFATILGALVLREPTGIHRWAAVFIGFIGVIIVAQPGSSAIPAMGAAIGLTAALLSGVVSILVRHIGKSEPPTTIVFYFATLSLPILAFLAFPTLKAHNIETWLYLIAVGLVGGIGQITMTRSLSLAPVAITLPMDYSGLLWATLFGYILFGTLPTPMTWVGAPIIILSGLYIVWREHVRAQAQTDRANAVE